MPSPPSIARWKDDPLVVDKWFGLQARSALPGTRSPRFAPSRNLPRLYPAPTRTASGRSPVRSRAGQPSYMSTRRTAPATPSSPTRSWPSTAPIRRSPRAWSSRFRAMASAGRQTTARDASAPPSSVSSPTPGLWPEHLLDGVEEPRIPPQKEMAVFSEAEEKKAGAQSTPPSGVPGPRARRRDGLTASKAHPPPPHPGGRGRRPSRGDLCAALCPAWRPVCANLVDNHDAVDDDAGARSARIAVGVRVGGEVLEIGGVEDRDIGAVTLLEATHGPRSFSAFAVPPVIL